MSASRQAISISVLGNLGACPLAIRAEPTGGYLAYLDFVDVFEPDCKKLEEAFQNLSSKLLTIFSVSLFHFLTVELLVFFSFF